MKASNMTLSQFEHIPYREQWDTKVICKTLVIIPARPRNILERIRLWLNRQNWERDNYIHDSGWRCMSFVAADEEDEPLCQISGCSDIVHIEGIGGFGYGWVKKLKEHGTAPLTLPVNEWSIDCLPRSGLLRLMSHSGWIICGAALSSFEIWSTDESPALWALKDTL